MARRMLVVHRKGFTAFKDVKPGPGVVMKHVKVPAATFKIKDRGAKDSTPKSKRFFDPKDNLHGWEKDMPMEKRRKLASIKRDDLSSARALQSLSNVTTDRTTKQAAKSDAEYFFRRHRESK